MPTRMSRHVRGALAALAVFGFAGAVSAQGFPSVIPLPPGWQPEGIASGRGPVLFVGSLAGGAVYAVDPQSGAGQVLYAGAPGQVAVGIEFDRRTNLLYVAGGPTGQVRVIDAATGTLVDSIPLASAGFINDAVLTADAVYFTDSQRPVIYRLPLGAGGRLLASVTVSEIPLTGDWQQLSGFNANGIEATPKGQLLVVNSTVGAVYRVDPATGLVNLVDLGGASVSFGDGLLLEGQTLYVVRNRLNQVVAIEMSSDFSSGVVAETITNLAFDVPTTLARFGSALYTVNARFGVLATPDTAYNVVRFR